VALWNALALELWRRTLGVTIYRALAHLLSLSEAEVKRLVRVRYMKVAEYQARGAIHFHAPGRLARWGEQLNVHQRQPRWDELSAEAVAAYIAKYATKSTEALVGVPGTNAGAAISLPASGRGRGKLEECAAVRTAEPAG
jgi:hypothetical protein